MNYEIDHVFVWTDAGAPAADRLLSLGFAEAPGREHPGQGTANRRFVFRNAMLEFLWVRDEREALAAGGGRLKLLDRWRRRNNGASPFGLCLRPADTTAAGDAPFPAWDYRPAWLPAARSIQVAGDSESTATPLLFCLPFATRADYAENAPAHTVGVTSLTGVRLHGPGLAAVGQRLTGPLGDRLETKDAEASMMDIVFDGRARSMSFDLSPALPIRLHW